MYIQQILHGSFLKLQVSVTININTITLVWCMDVQLFFLSYFINTK